VTNTIQKTYPPYRFARAQKLIQLTDCHLYANPDADHKGVKPGRTLEYVCRHIAKRHPDLALLLLTGDLSQDESVASYEWLKSVVSEFGVPVYALPGNHDERGRMLAAFGDRIRLASHIELSHWRIYLLDSTVPGETGGLLAQSELDRLQQDLQRYPVTPSLVALHHHPVAIGSAWMDRLGLHNSDALNSILQQQKQVKGVLFGHIHQEFLQRAGDILYLGTPSTCIQFKPNNRIYAVDVLPPAYRVLNMRDDGMFDTHIEYVASPENP
jgi:3',5'-cyclic-AMP phosphodiesterase